MSDFDFLDSLPQDHTVKLGEKRLPFMQWVNGSGQGKEFQNRGGPFVPADQIPQGITLEKNQPAELHFQSGGSKMGYMFQGVQVAILARRMDWGVQYPDGKRQLFASYGLAEAEAKKTGGSIAGRTRYAVFCKQLAPWYGPIMLTVWKTSGQHLDRAIEEFQSTVLDAVSRARGGAPVASYAFWIPLVPSPAQRANPKFPSMITPPTLLRSELADPLAYARKAFIGEELVARAGEVWKEMQTWASAALNDQGEPDTAVGATPGDGVRTGGAAAAPFRSAAAEPTYEETPFD